MIDNDKLEQLFFEHNYSDFKWINRKDIIVSQWVRIKCTFGCSSYGKKGSCPPNVPSVLECRNFFNEYNDIAIFHFEKSFKKPEDRFKWSKKVNFDLLKLERKVFLRGYHKTFLIFMDECCICEECTGTRIECKNKKASRPCAESFAMDVYTTVRNCGYPIEVLKNYNQTMNRYAFLLIN